MVFVVCSLLSVILARYVVCSIRVACLCKILFMPLMFASLLFVRTSYYWLLLPLSSLQLLLLVLSLVSRSSVLCGITLLAALAAGARSSVLWCVVFVETPFFPQITPV